MSVGGRFKAGTEDEVSIQEEINTFKGVNRIIRHAFEFAKVSGLTRVCMSDKSNAMPQGHALWQRVFREVAAEPTLRQRRMGEHDLANRTWPCLRNNSELGVTYLFRQTR